MSKLLKRLRKAFNREWRLLQVERLEASACGYSVTEKTLREHADMYKLLAQNRTDNANKIRKDLKFEFETCAEDVEYAN